MEKQLFNSEDFDAIDTALIQSWGYTLDEYLEGYKVGRELREEKEILDGHTDSWIAGYLAGEFQGILEC